MDIKELEALLREYDIDPTQYGVGEAKSLANLAKEVADGETLLTPVLERRVRVLSILVVYPLAEDTSLILREDRQEFHDGRSRTRNLSASIAEKLLPNEEVTPAVARALEEELGITAFELAYLGEAKLVRKESKSYPGLQSVYTTYDARVVIDPSEYKSEGYVEEQDDKTTYFVWCDPTIKI